MRKNLLLHPTARAFLTFLSLLLLWGISSKAQTKQAYVLLSPDKTTLSFYYDTQRESRTGQLFDMPEMGKTPGWFAHKTTITRAIFDASFADYRPTTTYRWFAVCDKLSHIEGISNLNTSEVTNMSNMFNGCTSLTYLDLSHFNTSKVTDMSFMFNACSALISIDVSHFDTSQVTNMKYMFQYCKQLETIYCADSWSCDKSDYMFFESKHLVGAVPYDKSKVDVAMANPTTGYFTKPATAIEEVIPGDDQIVEIYTPEGIRISELQEGVNIVKLSDGSVRKLYLQN